MKCEYGNFTNGDWYSEYEIDISNPVTVGSNETHKAASDTLFIASEQSLLGIIASNNSILLFDLRTGEFELEITHSKLPYGIEINQVESIITYIVGDEVKAEKLSGNENFSIEDCDLKIPGKEICLRCNDGLFPSKNLTRCWEEIPTNWYSFTLGHGSGHYFLVKFKFKDSTFEQIGLSNSDFIKNLSSDNVIISYPDSIESPTISLEDETTQHDISQNRKRFRIKYYANIEVSDIEVRFIYPNFGQFSSLNCPSFKISNLAVFEVNNYFPIKKIYSFWHTARDIYTIYAEGFKVFAFLIGFLKLFIILIRPLLKTTPTAKKMLFWMVYPIWLLEANSMIGFLGTNYRGVLGYYLEAQSSVIATGWLGIGDGGRWISRRENELTDFSNWGSDLGTISDDVFLGKFTEYGISPLFIYQEFY